MVRLPIMHGEFQAHKVREDGCGSLLRLDRGVVRWWGDLAGEGKGNDIRALPDRSRKESASREHFGNGLYCFECCLRSVCDIDLLFVPNYVSTA